MWNSIYQKLLKPRSRSEDDRRREVILNILLVGMIALSFSATMSAISDIRTQGVRYAGTASLPLLGINCVFLFLYILSRKNHYKVASYLFIGLLITFATYPLIIWGILVPQPLLIYCLVIVMAGILLSSRAAFYVTALIIGILFLITDFRYTGRINIDTGWMGEGGTYNDALIFGVTFLVLAVVAWLSNREIERSLKRARDSEKDLRIERNSLEVKVRERTKELEKAQVEKVAELNRFAEFGKVSSALLHELANPLTSMSLNLEQLEGKQQSKIVKKVRDNLTFMEEYIQSARLQLRKQDSVRTFDSAEVIQRVITFGTGKSVIHHITVQTQLAPDVHLLGDSVRFSQLVGNLVVNAIDAYSGKRPRKSTIEIKTWTQGYAFRLTVKDYGKGIKPKDLPKIFDPFFTTKSAIHGTGLGLTITKQLVEEDFRGKISVTSSKRQGTRFSVTLPLP